MNRRPAFAAKAGIIRDIEMTFRAFNSHDSLHLVGNRIIIN
jgi:hypothetical protein